MDFQNRAGNKFGGGGILSQSERNVDRRERMRLLAMEVTDLNKDPYIVRNNVGLYECKLCATIHNNEGNYLSHTQGKKHQTNLAKRKVKNDDLLLNSDKNPKNIKLINAIGKPGYKLSKIFNSDFTQLSLLIEIFYDEIEKNIVPVHKIVFAHEQNVEKKDENFKYLVVAAEPYETIGFKLSNKSIDYSEDNYKYKWDSENKVYTIFLTLNK